MSEKDPRFLDTRDIPLPEDIKDASAPRNKAYDTKQEESVEVSVGLEDIDSTIIKYMNEVISPYVIEDEERVQVPVMYAHPERWKSVRKDGVLHDRMGKLQIPLIMIRRIGLRKNVLNIPINKYIERNFAAVKWNSRNRYDKYAVQNGIQPSQRYVAISYPDYYDISYECIIWTDYMRQMNSLIEQISFEVENYWGERGKFKFKTSVEEYSNELDLPDKADRLVRSTFLLNVRGYLLPKSQVDVHNNPINMTKTRFTNKKLVINEKLLLD